MKPTELTAEWEHIYDTRIAILCGANEPTIEQRKIAAREADEHIEKLKQTP